MRTLLFRLEVYFLLEDVQVLMESLISEINLQIASRLRARAMSTILTITVLMPLPLPST